MDPVTQLAQDSNPMTSNNHVEEEVGVTTEDVSFLLEDDQSVSDFNDDQRTSTPTKFYTHFEEDGPNNGDALSPVIQSDAESVTLTHNQSSISQGGSFIQENSGEGSKSLYTSALSNINRTLASDSHCRENDQRVLENTLHHESLGACSTEDSTWATAHGSLQEGSDLSDVTIKHDLSPGNFSSNVDDSNNEKHGERTSENMTSANAEDWESKVNEVSNSEDIKSSDRCIASVEVNSPDLDILNEICEEATNMTIKEALICSLNPEVRAGLREGRLSLNESEILALEQYCEQFIENLISQLLAGNWPERKSEEANEPQPLEVKTKMAQTLSSFGLETLKSNCDRFVHSVITESLHDSCLRFQGKFTISPENNTTLNAQQMGETGLDKSSVEILLPLVKQSEAIQDYIGFLAADVIKSALANLSTSLVLTENGEKNDHMILIKNITSDDANEVHSLSENKERTQLETNACNEMWKPQHDSFQNKAKRDLMSSITSDGEFEGQYVGGIEGTLDDEHNISGSFNCALETSLEFDAGEWEGGGFLEDFNSLDTERKQKIVLRELSFDEHADVAGTELLAPVFLAIAEENDAETGIQGMRRKAQSIEDLCGIIDEPGDEKLKLQRSYSAPKRITPLLYQTSETEFGPEEDGVETKDCTEDDENEIVDDQEEEDDVKSATEEDTGEDGQNKEQDGQLRTDNRNFRWYTVSVNKRDKVLDLKLLEPYMKVISHGGYFSNTKSTIVVLAACYLPERSIKNYDFLMEQLFFYVISTLELLAVHEEYYLVYLNGGTSQQNMPSVTWMRRFYQYIEGGLKKKMKEMFIVHPSFRLKAVITLAKPFLSASFWGKLKFVSSLGILSSHIPVDYIYIPDEVMRVDPAYVRAHRC